MDYYDRMRALRLYSIQIRYERFMIINVWRIMEGYSDSVNEKTGMKVTMRNQARIGRMGYFKVPKLTDGKIMQVIAFKSFTCRVSQLSNRMPLEIREIKHVSQLSTKANISRFISRS